MTTITIRDVPEEVRDQLAGRAAREGRSMQSYLLELLSTSAARPTMTEILERARKRVSAEGTVYRAQDILDDRDADRP